MSSLFFYFFGYLLRVSYRVTCPIPHLTSCLSVLSFFFFLLSVTLFIFFDESRLTHPLLCFIFLFIFFFLYFSFLFFFFIFLFYFSFSPAGRRAFRRGGPRARGPAGPRHQVAGPGALRAPRARPQARPPPHTRPIPPHSINQSDIYRAHRPYITCVAQRSMYHACMVL
jgi:hypothetical protein